MGGELTRSRDVSDDLLQHELGGVHETAGSSHAVIYGGPEEVPIGAGAVVHHDEAHLAGRDRVAADLDRAAAQELQQSLNRYILKFVTYFYKSLVLIYWNSQ